MICIFNKALLVVAIILEEPCDKTDIDGNGKNGGISDKHGLQVTIVIFIFLNVWIWRMWIGNVQGFCHVNDGIMTRKRFPSFTVIH